MLAAKSNKDKGKQDYIYLLEEALRKRERFKLHSLLGTR
jgi:hypothetical protein